MEASEQGSAAKERRRRRWGNPVVSLAQDGQQASSVSHVDLSVPAEKPKRKRSSRWEAPEMDSSSSGALVTAGVFPSEIVLPGGIKVSLPSALTGKPNPNEDPLVTSMTEEYQILSRKLLTGQLDILPEGDPRRSPSPEPQYDRMGVRLNTREVRAKEKLLSERNRLIEELIKRSPSFRPPSDWKPQKKQRKIYIPLKEFPGYNFIGLIIGPRGNTQKRMQKETNTKIAIRGKGSVKEGAARDPKYDYGEEEELHVLIVGDNDDDVSKAASMVEKLLQPVDESRNEHKRMQLRELAALNGTLKDEEFCYLCGEAGHRQFECPSREKEMFQLSDNLKSKVDHQYARDVARMNPEGSGNLDDEYNSFLKELGGAPSASNNNQCEPSRHSERPGLGHGDRPKIRSGESVELPDNKLYVAYLPEKTTDSDLHGLFLSCGRVLEAKVIIDRVSQQSRGFGFVTMETASQAQCAIRDLNGHRLENRTITVRLASSSRSDAQSSRPNAYHVGHHPNIISSQTLHTNNVWGPPVLPAHNPAFQRHGFPSPNLQFHHFGTMHGPCAAPGYHMHVHPGAMSSFPSAAAPCPPPEPEVPPPPPPLEDL